MKFDFPGRSQRGPDPYESITHTRELKVDRSREGFVDDGNLAWPERVHHAARL